MDHEKKLAFVRHMTKLGLEHVQHFDSGGSVQTQGGGLLTPISDALGLSDKFQAGSADIQAGTNKDQLDQAYQGAQTGLNNQNNLTQTLIPQAQQGVNNQADLANQFAAQAAGQGPNVARNQLNEATGQNVANQAALMAGQRGASSNPALIARQAAQQGAAIQQQAAGQAATLGAQQQIAAQQNLANLSGQQISQAGQAVTNQNQAQQGEQSTLQNANTAANNAAVNMQSNVNNVISQTAAANQNSNNGLFGSIMKGASSAIGRFFAEGGEVDTGSLNPQTTAPLPQPSKEDSSSSSLESMAPMAMDLEANGGQIQGNPLTSPQQAMAPQSFVGQWLSGNNTSSGNLGGVEYSQLPKFQKFDDSALDDLKKKPPMAVGSSGELPGAGLVAAGAPPIGTMTMAGGPGSGEVMAAKGGQIKKHLAAKGGKVNADTPQEKAVVKNNSYANDKIPALLSEGEVVIPRKIMMHPKAPEKAAEFVRAILAKKSKGLRK